MGKRMAAPNQRLCGIRRSLTKGPAGPTTNSVGDRLRATARRSTISLRGGLAEAQAHAPLRSRCLALPAARCRRRCRCQCGGRAGGRASSIPRVPGLVWRGTRRWRCGPASASTESRPGARRALSSRRRAGAVRHRTTAPAQLLDPRSITQLRRARAAECSREAGASPAGDRCRDQILPAAEHREWIAARLGRARSRASTSRGRRGLRRARR